MALMPAETVLFLRTADAALLGERFAETNNGRLLADAEMADFVASSGQQLNEAYDERLKEVFGVELADLGRLPQGEIAFALVERPSRRPAAALLVDFGEQVENAQEIASRLQDRAKENGRSVTTESLRNDEATLVRRGNNQNRVIALVQRETAFVLATDRDLLQSILDRWDGVPVGYDVKSDELDATDDLDESLLFTQSLSDNPAFGATMRECLPGREEPPQAIFFADPIGIVRAVAGRQTPVRLAMATFPALGLDGVQGLGGAMWLATDKWDSLLRGHLLLDNPRAGVMKIARLEPGDAKPPTFVPADIETVVVGHADPQRMFEDINRLVDRFRYDGAFRETIRKNLSERLGVDFVEDFIDNLAGHIYVLTGYDEGQLDVNGRLALALQVTDPDKARVTLTTIAEKFPDAMRPQSVGSVDYFVLGPQREQQEGRPFRPPNPAVGVVGDALMVASSEPFFTRCIDAQEGLVDRYVDSLPLRLVTSRLNRLSAGATPSLTMYQDNSATSRHWHGILSREGTIDWLSERAETNPVLRAIRNTLEEGGAPPLDAMLKYSGPGGAVVYDTPTGFHMIGFGFKRATSP